MHETDALDPIAEFDALIEPLTPQELYDLNAAIHEDASGVDYPDWRDLPPATHRHFASLTAAINERTGLTNVSA